MRRMAILVTALALSAPASAEPNDKQARAAVVQRLVDCRKLADSATRLACYDAAATALDEAEAKGDVVVVDREQARKVRRQAFGFSLPSISLFEKGESKEDIETVTAKVASARQDSAGHWIIKLDDGAIWTQVDAKELFKTPKPGMPVRIRKASLGSYLVIVDNQGAFRGRRVE